MKYIILRNSRNKKGEDKVDSEIFYVQDIYEKLAQKSTHTKMEVLNK